MEIKLPKNKEEQIKLINETEHNIVYFRPKGFCTGVTFKCMNVKIEEDFCDIPTGLKGSGMRIKKEYIFYSENGDYKRYLDPVFIKLEVA